MDTLAGNHGCPLKTGTTVLDRSVQELEVYLEIGRLGDFDTNQYSQLYIAIWQERSIWKRRHIPLLSYNGVESWILTGHNRHEIRNMPVGGHRRMIS